MDKAIYTTGRQLTATILVMAFLFNPLLAAAESDFPEENSIENGSPVEEQSGSSLDVTGSADCGVAVSEPDNIGIDATNSSANPPDPSTAADDLPDESTSAAQEEEEASTTTPGVQIDSEESGGHKGEIPERVSSVKSEDIEAQGNPEQGSFSGDIVPGNSYIASVVPENGKSIEQGNETSLTVTFVEMGESPQLGSARLFIPDSLLVDTEAEVEISAGWDYKWEDPVANSTFSKVFSLWAVLDTDYLGKGNSVSATFTATANADQTHHFDTTAWQDAKLDEDDKGTGVSDDSAKLNNYYGYNSSSEQYDKSYSQPKLNVWVDRAESGYREESGDSVQVVSLEEARSCSGSNLHVGLDDLRDNLNWHYVQTEEIELDDYLSSEGAGYNSGAGWDPAGSLVDPFYGGFAGNGYTISGLSINRPDEKHVGLFGYLEEGSVINNVKINNADVKGKEYVGILAGENRNGTIGDSSVSGTVTAAGSNAGGLVGQNYWGTVKRSTAFANVTGTKRVGGLTGSNRLYGIITGSSAGCLDNNQAVTVIGDEEVGGLVGFNQNLIEDSYSALLVEGSTNSSQQFGGLVGHNNNRAVINRSYATGSINAAYANSVGGLVGENANSNIHFSYASGNVAGKKYVGGLVGYNNSLGKVTDSYASGETTGDHVAGGLIGINLGIIERCYAVGQVLVLKPGGFKGGLVGHNSGGTLSNSYFLNTGHNNNLGEAKSEEELLDLDTYTGWSIDHIDNIETAASTWYIDNGNGYPILWWQYQRDNENGGENGEEGENPSDNNPGNGNNKLPSAENYNLPRTNSKPSPLQGHQITFTTNQFRTVSINQYLLLFGTYGLNNNETALVTADFIKEGNQEYYDTVLAAYKNLIYLVEARGDDLSAEEYAIAKMDIAVAYAALKTVEARLSGQEYNLKSAWEAYDEARSVLYTYGDSLSDDQFLQGYEILETINKVLTNLEQT